MNELTTAIKTRWFFWKDYDDIEEIERLSSSKPRSRKEFESCMDVYSSFVLVAEYGGRVRGFVLCFADGDAIQVYNVVVHPNYRRLGLGSALVNRVKQKLKDQFVRAEYLIRESNLTGQLFLKKHNFLATRIDRDYFEKLNGEEGHEDAYTMAYHRGR